MAKQRVEVQQDLGVAAIRPVATPVDTFSRPDVRQRNAGRSLIQLAQSLAAIRPELQQVANRRMGHMVEEATRRARADAARLKNQQGFKEAVKRGEIKEQDNPWYMLAINQEIARNDAVDIVNRVRTEFSDSDLLHSNDPEAVEKFFRERFDKALENRDVVEVEAMAPIFDDATQKTVQRHIALRSEQRVQERHLSLSTNFANAVVDLDSETVEASMDASHPDNAKAIEAVEQYRAKLKTIADEAAKTMSWSQVNDLMINAVTSVALENGNSNIARQLLSDVKTPGGKLADIPAVRQRLSQLDQQVETLRMQRMNNEENEERILAHREARAFYDRILERRAASGEKDEHGFPLPLSRYVDFAELDQLSPAVGENVRRMIQNALSIEQQARGVEIRRNRDEALVQLGQAVDTQNWDEVDRIKGVLLALNGASEAERVLKMLQSVDYAKKYASITSTDTMRELMERASSGTLDYGWFVDATNRGLLDRKTADAVGNWLLKTALSGEDTLAGLSSPRDRMLQRFIISEQQRQLAEDLPVQDSREILRDEVKRNEWDQINFQLTNELAKLKELPEYMEADPIKRYEMEEQMMDVISRQHTLVTSEQLQEGRKASRQERIDAGIVPVVEEIAAEEDQPTEAPVTTPADPNAPKAPAPKASVPVKKVREVMVISPDPVVNRLVSNDVADKVKAAFQKTDSMFTREIPKFYAPDEPTAGNIRDRWNREYVRLGMGFHDELTGLLNHRHYYRDYSTVPEKPVVADRMYKRWGVKDVQNEREFAQRTEIARYNQLMARLQYMKPNAEAAIRHMEVIADLINKGETTVDWRGNPRMDAREALFQAANEAELYLQLRRHLGYTAEEVKEMGRNAWKSVPMFANELDLKLRAEEVAKTLGLTDAQLPQLVAAQITLIKEIRNVE